MWRTVRCVTAVLGSSSPSQVAEARISHTHWDLNGNTSGERKQGHIEHTQCHVGERCFPTVRTVLINYLRRNIRLWVYTVFNNRTPFSCALKAEATDGRTDGRTGKLAATQFGCRYSAPWKSWAALAYQQTPCALIHHSKTAKLVSSVSYTAKHHKSPSQVCEWWWFICIQHSF